MRIYLLLIIFIVSANLQAQDLANLKDQKPIKFSGGVNVNISTYHNLSGKTDRLDPFSWTLSATPTATVYGVQIPFFFLLNKQSRSLTGPFQQFGLSPSYKWLKLHLGYRNITFSPYTLGGRLFNGVGLELNPGKFRFGATYGQFQKAEIGYLSGVTTVTANLPNGITPAFKRTGFATKLGFGSERNFIDLSILRIQDDPNSLTVPKNFAAVTPDENIVLGLTNQVFFFKKLFFKSDIGLSIYTRDVRKPLFENEKLNKLAVIKDFVNLRTGSSFGYAGETALGIQFDKFSLQGQYKLVSLDYQSMGAYFFNTDIEEVTVSGNATLATGKIQIAGTYGVQNDNVSKIKEFTTNRKIGSANINLQFTSALGLSINYSNFGTTQNLQQRVIDTLKIAQVNQSLMIAPRWFKMMGKTSHSINGVLSYQNANDLNTVSKVQTDFNNLFASVNYSYGRPVQKITLTPGLIYIQNLLPIYNTTSVGVSFMAQKGSKNNSLTSSLSVNYTSNIQNREANGSTLNARINSSYKLSPKQQLNFSISTIVNADKKIERRNFQEIYMNAGYGINF
jgi:hypothetical protein